LVVKNLRQTSNPISTIAVAAETTSESLKTVSYAVAGAAVIWTSTGYG
jgi:hypothetical protein